ncbi:MAG: hypothetical protein LLG06_02855 [Desulfobacteraceae bacterium]|nr:hypothetical protein [Desulfobacteraceae bacterium]
MIFRFLPQSRRAKHSLLPDAARPGVPVTVHAAVGMGIHLTGRHEIMSPLLMATVYEKVRKEES